MVNKNLEVYNSALILQYAKLDSRFRQVALYLKQWSNKYFAKKTRLNNYSLYLMLIAYMQKKGLLPNLQALAGVNTRQQQVSHQQTQGSEQPDIQFRANVHFATCQELERLQVRRSQQTA